MLQRQGWIVGTVAAIALLSSTPARAQYRMSADHYLDPHPNRDPGGLVNIIINGAYIEKWTADKAAHRIEKLQAKLNADAARGDAVAVDNDAFRIERNQHRIAVSEWMIQKNLYDCPGPAPRPFNLDPISCVVIAQYHQPGGYYGAPPPTGPQQMLSPPVQIPPPISAPPLNSSPPVTPPSMDPNTPATPPIDPNTPTTTPLMPVTIINAKPEGEAVAFDIDGVTHQAPAGSRKELTVAPGSRIAYNAGGSLGQRRYNVSPGVYEFRSSAEGLALYKLAKKD